MCRVDFGADPPQVYSVTEYTARKEHKCNECGRFIKPGEKYQRAFGVYDGCSSTYRTCAHCLVAQAWLIENCDGFVHFEVYEEVVEHAMEYKQIRFGMLRLKIGMNRRWERFDKTGLMKLQPMPRNIEDVL